MTATTIDRTTGLGGSDMAAVLGIDRWRSPLDLYLEKVGETPGFEGNEATELGDEFEDKVAILYAKRTGNRVRRDRREHRHPEHPWAMAHVDRQVVGQPRILEIKCSSASGWGEEGTDQIPESMLPQVHHYLGITGAEVCDVAALLWGGYGPPRLQLFEVPRDDEMVALLFAAGDQFWQEHVLARVPPDPRTSQEASTRWRRAVAGACVEASDDVLRAIAALEDVKQREKALKEERDGYELELKRTLQDSEAIVDEQGKPLITWKAQTSRRFDVTRFKNEHPELALKFQTASSFRVLRTSKRAKERLAQPEGSA